MTQGVTSISGHQFLLKCQQGKFGEPSSLERFHLVLWDEWCPFSNSYIEVLNLGNPEGDSIGRQGLFKEVIKMKLLGGLPSDSPGAVI